MEIYGSITFQSSVSTYGYVTFQSSIKLVMEIYGSISEAGELGPRQKTNHLHIDITNTKSSHISLLTISTFFIKNSTLSLQLKFAFPKLIHKVPEQQKTRLCCDIKKFNLSRIEKLLQLHCQIPLFY